MENSATTVASLNASLPGRYANALYALASETGNEAGAADTVEVVESDLARLGAAIATNDDLARLIRNPEVSRRAATKAMAGIAQVLELHAITGKFLGVLAENRRLSVLPEIMAAYRAIAAAARGEVSATVTSAHSLSSAQLQALSARLAARAGQAVNVTPEVDPALLGGLVVRIGSRQIDSSLRTRLNRLAQHIAG